MMIVPPSPGDAMSSAPQAARVEQATLVSMIKRMRAKAAMKFSVPGVRRQKDAVKKHRQTKEECRLAPGAAAPRVIR
jgi:hypothetical protein